MKKIGHLYNSIADNYSKVDYFHIISSAIDTAIKQIQDAHLLEQQHLRIIDLGAGDGKFLEALRALSPQAQLIALDASADMLKLASRKIDITPIVGNIEKANYFFSSHQFNLVIASFVCSYVGLPKLLEQGNYLLDTRGYFAILTTTKKAFANAQAQAIALKKSFNPLKQLFYFWTKKTLAKTKVPDDREEIFKLAKDQGYEICQVQQLITAINFKNPDEVLEFAQRGGWALSLLDYRAIPTTILSKLGRWLAQTLNYPFHDQIVVEIVLLKKTT